MKIPLLVFMSEIKINLTPEKSNLLFLSCLNVEKINLFQSVSRHHRKLTFFLVITRQFCVVQRIYWVLYWVQTESVNLTNGSLEIFNERMPAGG